MKKGKSQSWLSHEVYGDTANPLVVFLHGFLGNRHDWDDIVAELAPSYCCLTVDLPGHGDTKTPDEGDYSFIGAGPELIGLIDSLKAPSMTLVGYSMGGRLAFHLASIYPMRIDRLVLESTSPGIRDDQERYDRDLADFMLAETLERGPFGEFLEGWYSQPLFASLEQRPALREELIRRRRKNRPTELAQALRHMSVGHQPSRWETLLEHYIPTLLITGHLDEKYTGIAFEMAAICPAMDVAVVPGCGHCVHFEDPASYTRLIKDFLEAG
jgi:2-succinyl-6-hydroxy-2,4-cyclohexadiene-1-carboxylate synthase